MSVLPHPRVTVILPTVGRPQLAAALRSVLDQELAPFEVIVVNDRPTGAALEVHAEVTVLSTAGGQGPAAARMLGVRAATGEVIAFLDDDDVWEPEKLALQVAAWQQEQALGIEAVVACRIRVVDERGETRAVVPEREQHPDEPFQRWVFRRESLRPAGYILGSSTLLCSRSLLLAEPLDEQLRLHEDWDWVLRAARRPGVQLRILSQPLVHYRDAPGGPAASRPVDGWRRSLAWVDTAPLPARERGDLLLSVTADLAWGEGKRGRALLLVLHALRTARPGLPALAGFVLQLLLPASLLRRLGSRVGARRAFAVGQTGG